MARDDNPSRASATAAGSDPKRALLMQALEAQSAYVPEMRAEIGPASADWTSSKTFWASDAALDDFIAFEQSRYEGVDAKTAGAFIMNDYGYILSATTVPLFVGFGLIPDLSLSSVALKFYTTERRHEGKVYRARRANVRFVERGFQYGHLSDPEDGERFRSEIETHLRPVVDRIHATTRLSRAALWRLAGDAIADRFLDAGRQFGIVETAKAAAMRILKVPGSPLTNRELQYFDVTIFDRHQKEFSTTFQQRGGCCRFYCVEGGAYCTTCVLKAPADRDEELRQAVRDRLGIA